MPIAYLQGLATAQILLWHSRLGDTIRAKVRKLAPLEDNVQRLGTLNPSQKVSTPMRVVILAGGRGTRLQEETTRRPKPMVEIGGKPILWHIMKHYAHYGFHDFVIALGYLGDNIKEYFLNCLNLSGNLSVDFAKRSVHREHQEWEDWTVHLVDTGSTTLTGGRIKRLEPMLASSTFMVTYGDGVSDVDLNDLLQFHRSHGGTATITAVRPPARFGGLTLDGVQVRAFAEKPNAAEGWINGGFLVFEPEVFRYLHEEGCSLEGAPLEQLAREGNLFAYRHEGFWQCMDTLREKDYLENLWQQDAAPWRTWGRGDSDRQARAA